MVDKYTSQLKEFDEFLRENYSENERTRKTLISAVHRLLESGMDPDDLPISSRSKSVYRRAWRLWNEFQTYKRVNAGPVVSRVRKAGVIKDSKLRRSLKSVLKNEVEYRMSVLKAINSGRVAVSYLEDEPKLIYID